MLYYVYDYHTHTCTSGSNSTTAPGSTVVELITFAVLSWCTVLFAFLAVLIMYLRLKIEESNTVFYG